MRHLPGGTETDETMFSSCALLFLPLYLLLICIVADTVNGEEKFAGCAEVVPQLRFSPIVADFLLTFAVRWTR